MNINKIAAIALALVFTLSLFAGCGSSTPVKEKDAGKITIFVDSTMKGALTAAATAYTKPVREKPEREKAIILINSASTEDIVKKLEDGEYYWADIIGCDAVFSDNGKKLGVIDSIIDTKSNDVYVVKTDKDDVLIPALKIYVTVDAEHNTVYIHRKGLEEILPDED